MNSELARAKWFKSTRSGASKDCVEVAHLANGRIGMRDSKNPAGPALVFSGEQWDVFTAAVMIGEI
ncbi:DUF397 domain-containing protein [Nocardia panacis]|uniref:DUF397 domain-containing protein n=1 Tax=Nocardia panacis TaxID=2340916 RepID=A0A3A4KMZ1_9NOCA|nr:DUF397 domain-containing protein [Nocardia panacis]RJO76928.1 DUF397 domain-containing protein [Nocardia panacis]